MSTSGYGGVLPLPGAIVADMSGMGRLLEVDAAAKTARVQGGALWEKLQKELNAQGLDLRLYPSSLPSSTVAGWLAQGGAGFGSYEYGFFKDSVLGAREVQPDGAVAEFTGEQLEQLVADAEGITGVITEVTIALRELEDEVHRVIAFPDAGSIEGALKAISAQHLPIWSITFLNPESVRLKKTLPHRHGHPYEMAHTGFEPELPLALIAVIAYPVSRRSAVDDALTAIADANGGTEMDAETAEHEWEQRFAPMRLKRVGPSIVPTEVVVPLEDLATVLGEIGTRIKQPFILEGMLGKGDKVVLLGFIPHDERSLAFNLAFALSLVVIKIAKQHRGGAYSTGLFFRQEAKSVLGEKKYRALEEYKRAKDPGSIMNPKKVLGTGAIMPHGHGSGVRAAGPADRERRQAPDRRPGGTKERNGIPADVAYYSYACGACGYCVPTCEEYSVRGWMSHSPRGKYLYLRDVIEGREKIDHTWWTRSSCVRHRGVQHPCQLQLPSSTRGCRCAEARSR